MYPLLFKPTETNTEETNILGSDQHQIVETQNVTFIDNGDNLIIPSRYPFYSAEKYGLTPNVDLGEFFRRPIRIETYNWLTTDPVGTPNYFHPWERYFNETYIKYKLNNYSYIRCKLHLKFIINASPFYYGAFRYAYRPLHSITPNNIINDVTLYHLIPYSQMKGVWIYPSSCQGAEMVLPFVYHKDWLRIQNLADFTGMGRMYHTPYVALASANGASGTGCSMQVFAWAEDVELSGPSVGLSMQGGDEYVEGSVSKIASTVASVAGALSKFSFIKPFAIATQIGASAVSSIAHIFGWSNVPIIAPQNAVQVRSNPPLATPDVQFPVDKLSLDVKNELSVDATQCGCNSDDMMIIANIAKIDSYIATASWSTSTNVDTILFSTAVAPGLFAYADQGTYGTVYATPLAYLSQLFNYWRGDLIYTFKIIASPFHKGRLRISFDPQGYSGANIYVVSTTTNVVYTEIIDIAEKQEVEFVVPYMASMAFCNTRNMTSSNILWSTSSTPTFNHQEGVTNGCLTVRCLTTLSAPLASSTVSILVSVRSENMEFASPVSRGMNDGGAMYSFFIPQGEEEELETSTKISLKDDTQFDIYSIYFGERILSLRQYAHRLTCVTPLSISSSGSGIFYTNTYLSNVPPQPGYSDHALSSAKGIIDTGTSFSFQVGFMDVFSFISPCFVGWRGAHHYMYVVVPGVYTQVHTLTAARNIKNNPSYIANSVTSITTTADSFKNLSDTLSGATFVSTKTQSVLNFSLPFYSKYKFTTTNPFESITFTTMDNNWLTYRLQAMCTSTQADTSFGFLHHATGPDFQLIEFVCVPMLYVYENSPHS